MLDILALVLAAAADPAPATTAPSVEVASGDWSQLPALEQWNHKPPSPKMMARLFEISEGRTCRLPGQGYRRLDLQISFAAQYSPDGTLQRLVLPKLDCPEAEGILAGAVLEMLKSGAYRRSQASELGWYRGTFGFGYS